MASTEPTSAATAPGKTATKKTTPATPAKKRIAAAKSVPKPAVKSVAVATKAVSTTAPANDIAKSAKPKLATPPASAPAAAPVTKPSEAKAIKEKKPKMVRDSMTIPKAEYQALDAMKQRAAQLQTIVKKTELIRAGIKLLSTLPDAAFLTAVAAVPSLKTGRPSKN